MASWCTFGGGNCSFDLNLELVAFHAFVHIGNLFYASLNLFENFKNSFLEYFFQGALLVLFLLWYHSRYFSHRQEPLFPDFFLLAAGSSSCSASKKTLRKTSSSRVYLIVEGDDEFTCRLLVGCDSWHYLLDLHVYQLFICAVTASHLLKKWELTFT